LNCPFFIPPSVLSIIHIKIISLTRTFFSNHQHCHSFSIVFQYLIATSIFKHVYLQCILSPN
jgi:hypothetical protein